MYVAFPLPVSLPFDCEFESDTCGMVQQTDDDFDWTRHSRLTDSSGTGPDEAHSGTYFLYTEASSQTQGDTAV